MECNFGSLGFNIIQSCFLFIDSKSRMQSFPQEKNLQIMILSIALIGVEIAILSNPASGFSLRKVGHIHSRNRMTFELGHEHSLPPRCWEVASPECNEQKAINVLHACVKSTIYNPSAAISVGILMKVVDRKQNQQTLTQ